MRWKLLVGFPSPYVEGLLTAILLQANIHAFLETDDRIGAVMTQLDEAVQELDEMDRNLSGYKVQLNVGKYSPTNVDSR